jgi:type III pantothenate kinase
MIVLIDAGNTRVKFGWLKPDTGERETVALALHHASLDQLNGWLAQLPVRPAAAIGVNVAGEAVAARLQTLLAKHTGPIAWISSQRQSAGLRNAYRSPGQLGADRWVSLIGLARRVDAPARASAPAQPGTAQWLDPAREPAADAQPAQAATGRLPLMLATFGTATTLDTLIPAAGMPEQGESPPSGAATVAAGPSTESGHPAVQPVDWVFPGGLIFPGPALMNAALAQGTANLPHASGDMADYPDHTHQAIATGIAAAQAGAVMRQWLLGLERYGQAPRVYSAGGGWPAVQEETQRLLAALQTRLGLPSAPIEWLATPVLDGLAGLAGSAALASVRDGL